MCYVAKGGPSTSEKEKSRYSLARKYLVSAFCILVVAGAAPDPRAPSAVRTQAGQDKLTGWRCHPGCGLPLNLRPRAW